MTKAQCHRRVPGYNNGDVQNMFLQGQLAFACNWPYMWKMTKDEDASKVSGKVGVVAQPVANAMELEFWGESGFQE